jgi:hypothetical protein
MFDILFDIFQHIVEPVIAGALEVLFKGGLLVFIESLEVVALCPLKSGCA